MASIARTGTDSATWGHASLLLHRPGSNALRDLVLLIALVGIAPLIWRAPIVGVLAWIWVAVMNPQREVFGFLAGFQLNLVIAVFTALAWMASRERKYVPPNAMTVLIVLFGAWSCLTTYLALDPAYSSDIWQRTLKTLVLALAVIALATTKTRIQAVVWTFVAALGYYGVKGGGFLLLTGGRSHVYGPLNTMIEDNNNVALALIALVPMLNYLRVSSERALVRWACLGGMVATLLAILGTYSRGALIALVATGAAFAVRSRAGLAALVAGGIAALSLPAILPSGWFARMSSIQAYNGDASFEGRVQAWQAILNIIQERPLIGGGFSATNLDWVAQTYGGLPIGKAAHSIYFEVLCDTGIVGLALYLGILGVAVFNTFYVLRLAGERADLGWARRLARMLQVSIFAYLVGGAALSMAYYDGFLILIALTTALVMVVKQPVNAEQNVRLPLWKQGVEEAPAALAEGGQP